jgi:regulator of RNase E activity RraA
MPWPSGSWCDCAKAAEVVAGSLAPNHPRAVVWRPENELKWKSLVGRVLPTPAIATEEPTTMPTPQSILDRAQLDALRRYNTPTVSNAIETFDVRPRHTGFLPHTVRCLLPELGAIIGYAVTSKTRAAKPELGEPSVDLLGDYLRYVAAQPGPKIAVGEDLDDPPGLGAQFGEVTATIHQKLGCVGHITSGCPRDLDEVRALKFQLFGLNPCVSHAYVRLVEFGTPARVGSVVIQPGDLIHADQHGVCLIPHEIAPRLAEACALVERRERPFLELCRSPDFSLERYIGLRSAAQEAIRE